MSEATYQSTKNISQVEDQIGITSPQSSQSDNDIDPNLVTLLKGKYDIVQKIGKGAQSHVYYGKRCSDNMPVAIKQMRVNSAKDWKQYELFDREAEVLKSLNVPGTAKFYEAIKALDGPNPTSLIVQEYIDGRSLQNYIDQQTRFSFEVICDILLQILEILKKLHQRNPPVIHRDIKPSNIILRYDDDKYAETPEVFIIDFGAVANPQVKDGGSTVTGTYGYMAPEQLIGQPSPASDIYAFGILAVYLFSGMPPEKIEIKDLQLLIDPHLEHLPYAVTSLLRQLTEPSLQKRLTNYDTIRKSLRFFKKHKFDLSIRNVSSKNITHQLNHVQTIGQKGNVALWQALPQNTPRKIPKTYKTMIHRDRIFWPLQNIDIGYKNFKEYQEYTYPETLWLKHIETKNKILHWLRRPVDIYKNELPDTNLSDFLNNKLAYFIAIIFFSCFLFVLATLFIDQLFSTKDFLFLIPSFLYLLAYPIGFIYAFILIPKYRRRWNQEQPFDYQLHSKLPKDKQKKFKKKLRHIFIHGRKSLATISDIQVIIPKHKSPRIFPSQMKPQGKISKREQRLNDEINAVIAIANEKHDSQYDKLRPLWKIEYCFNPPDDNNPDPIHHVYYSEVPPVNLQIGDSLPILYYIKHIKRRRHDPIFKGKVYSIPYPLPTNSSLMLCPDLVSDLGIHIET